MKNKYQYSWSDNFKYAYGNRQIRASSPFCFLDAVIENATVKRAQSQVEQVRNQYRLQSGIGGIISDSTGIILTDDIM